MKMKILKPKFYMKAALALSAILFTYSSGNNLKAQVVLDSHSAANGASTWNITTHHANELIIISAGGYAWSTQLSVAPGTVTVNGNNATYETEGLWVDPNFSWQEEIWAYVAATPGTYACACTEAGLSSPFYFNYASCVYENCPIGLSLGNVIIGGNNNNHGPTTINASITTTLSGTWVYGSIDNNDNGGTGTVLWNGQLTELDHTYISDGVDGAQADSTYATPGTYNITSTDIGASNVWMTIALIGVQPSGNNNCCTLTATASTLDNVSCTGGSNGSALATPANGHAPYTYIWNPSAQTSASATGLTAGTYTVIVSDTIGCSATATVVITQPLLALSASIIPTNILCNGGTGSAAATAAGGTGAYTYSWTTAPVQTTANASGFCAGSYTLTVTDANGCTTSVSTTITQPAIALSVTVTGPSVICAGSPGVLTANAAGGTVPYAYAWSSGITSVTSTASITPLVSQNYTVTVTDANGCTATGQIAIDLGPSLSATISGANSMCSGLSTTLCGNSIGGTGGNTYLWQPGNQTTPCITVSPASTSTYTLSVVDNCGTTATITATVRINPSPAIGFTANLYQGCAPLCVQFYNTTTLSQGGAAQYVWTFGNGDSSHAQSPSYCYPSNGIYTIGLTVTSDSGCSSTLTRDNLIKAFARPVAAFSSSPQPATILAPTIQFTDNSKDKYNIMYWNWSFGDGTDSNSNMQNPAHTYQDTGTYCTNLVVMDIHGCTDTATNCLVINPAFNLYIPSAFSPNGDGKNEVFQPKGQFIKSFEMYIFDRWGMQLFHTTDINNGWNGSVGGSSGIAQEDTYVYKIKVTDSQNNQHTYVGNVNLIK